MVRAQIYLTDDERSALRLLANQTGQSQSELIRQAIDTFIEKHQETSRLKALQMAKGMWKDRDDLPDLRELRAEFDRY